MRRAPSSTVCPDEPRFRADKPPRAANGERGGWGGCGGVGGRPRGGGGRISNPTSSSSSSYRPLPLPSGTDLFLFLFPPISLSSRMFGQEDDEEEEEEVGRGSRIDPRGGGGWYIESDPFLFLFLPEFGVFAFCFPKEKYGNWEIRSGGGRGKRREEFTG